MAEQVTVEDLEAVASEPVLHLAGLDRPVIIESMRL